MGHADGRGVRRRGAVDDSFQQFVRQHQGTLFGFAVNLCGDRVLAEDLVADVWTTVCEKWARISAVDYPLAYVRRMVLNEFLKDRMRRIRTSTTASGDVPGQNEATPDPAIRHAELAALTGQLSTLPRQQRAALVLRFFLDLTDADIADELGCTAGTVRSYVSRGLAALRVTLDDPDETGEADDGSTDAGVGDARGASNPLPANNSAGDQAVQFRLLPHSAS